MPTKREAVKQTAAYLTQQKTAWQQKKNWVIQQHRTTSKILTKEAKHTKVHTIRFHLWIKSSCDDRNQNSGRNEKRLTIEVRTKECFRWWLCSRTGLAHAYLSKFTGLHTLVLCILLHANCTKEVYDPQVIITCSYW